MTRKVTKRPDMQMRRKARQKAVQALYQWEMNGAAITTIESEFYADNDMSKIDTEYFREVLHQIPSIKSDLDAKIQSFVDRPLARMTPVELSILRLGTYELIHRIDVPYRVIINEGVELAKVFGSNDGHKYINGVLDKMAQEIRLKEISKKKKKS